MRKYGQILKEERLYRKISQEKLAQAIGVTQQAISLYEKDVHEPTIGVVERIADFYEISIDELVGRDFKEKSF